MADFDKAIAAYLYDHLEITVTKSHLAPRLHKGSVIFCGYADFQVSIDKIPFLQLCGNSIKLMGDQVHFDPKSEEGKGDRAGSFFPHWFPMTREARIVLTEKLKRDPAIIAMCDEAVSQLTPATSAVANNPFGS